MQKSSTTEQGLLKQSILAALVFAVLSFVIGLLFRSQVILFDGLYSVISVTLSLSTLAALRFMGKADWERFPFGKDTVEPLVIIVKYLALIALVMASTIAAVIALFTGGRDVMVGPGLIYAAFAVVFGYFMFRHLTDKNRTLDSRIVQTEINEWYLDTIISVGVLLGFALGLGMTYVPALAPYVIYIDPVMVILLSVYFLRWPITSIQTSLREVLDMKPEGGLAEGIQRVVNAIQTEHAISESFVRVSKVANTLWLEIDFVVGPQGRVETIEQQDALREEIMARIPREGMEIWLTVAFTNNRKWAIA
ncbi:cation diffusion facilitator family transporter [Alkalilimnicola ehrlichii]|nr:cation diffusion facilitator family transporter [Alkalilimnicola ehrlichii]